MKTRIVLVVLALGLVVACTSSVTGLKKYGEYEPLRVDAPVKVWLDGNPPGDLIVAAGPNYRKGPGPADMVKVADFNLRKVAAESWETLVKNGKIEARKMGADGLVIRWKSGYTVTAPRVAVTVFRYPPKK